MEKDSNEKTTHTTTLCLYCTCKQASHCKECGKPMKNREETKLMVKELQSNPRLADYSTFGNGPLFLSNIPPSAISSIDAKNCNKNNSSNDDKNNNNKIPVHVGIDEAGRGSVLGPMVYGAAYWSVSVEENGKIPKGFQDSKTLTDETRMKLFEKDLLPCEDIGFVVRSLLPSEISRHMLRKEPYNLNQMSHDSAILMIHKLVNAGIYVTKCFIDTVGNPSSYKRKLEREFPSIEFVVESKADAKYATCSAASVVAKVMRDRMLSNWVSSVPDVSPAFGSGYPSDPKCKAWMEKIQDPLFGYCDLIRFSWAPTKHRLEEQGLPVTFEADIDDEDELQQQKGMSSFLTGGGGGGTSSGKNKRKRLGYFEKRKLRVVESM